MSLRTDDLYLVDIIETASDVQTLVLGAERSRLDSDVMFRGALLWNLYVLAEASSRISESSRSQFHDVPWQQLRGFRNRLAHGYFTLKWDVVWDIAVNHVPSLRSQAEQILAAQFPHVSEELKKRQTSERP
jgi:uncharacterized protein with HEPN domain